MSARIKRLRHLAAELEGSIQALAGTITSSSALVFLDTLARCEQYDLAEIEAAGATELVELARSARESERAALADWAADEVHSGALADGAYALAENGTAEAIQAWASDLMRAANTSAWLPATTQQRLGEALFDCCRIVEANPASFSALAALARDRMQCEGPAFGEALSDVLQAFQATEELARIDAGHASVSAANQALFDRLLEAAAGSEALDDAREALEDAAGWRASVLHLVARQQRAPAAQLRFAAKDDERDAERILLRRFDDGEFLLAAIGGSLAIEWWGKGTPDLAIDGAPLDFEPTEWGLRWRLPPTDVAALALELRVDGERHSLELPLRGA